MAMHKVYVSPDSVLKTNGISHNVNTAKRVVKLVGIWKYAAKGDATKMNRLLSKGESPHVENEEKRTALHYAAENGHVHCVTILLAAGAHINHRDMRGDTATHCALRAKREEMSMFLVSKGCDLNITNVANISCWELADKISRRFAIKLKESTKCSNPSSSSAPAPKPKPAAAAPTTTQYNLLLNQALLYVGEYVMYLRKVPPPGTPDQQPPRPAPFPATAHEALKITHSRLNGYMNELVLALNKDASTSPSFRGSCQSLKETVARQSELTKVPFTDLHIFNSLHNDLFNITNTSIDILSQYEESMVSRAFSSHLEKFTISMKSANEAGDKWDSSEFVIDFVRLNRNVLTQLLYIGDPEKSRNISDGLLQLSKAVQSFATSKSGTGGMRTPADFSVRTIADSLRKIHVSLSQSGASSALFAEEEREVFDGAIRAFDEILALQVPIIFGAKRSIQIMLSELAYMKEAAFASPTDRDVLLNCALFVQCTCSRVAKLHTDRSNKEPVKTVVDHVAGLLTLCGNFVLLVACALVAKNRNYHYVHMGYALRCVAAATALLVNPAFGITTY